MSKDVLLILGSKSDKRFANTVLETWKKVGLTYRVAIASCHKHGGGEFKGFIDGIDEKIIVFLGGMSLAAPGLIEMLRQKAGRNAIVFGIPTDKAALSAIQDLPKGTPVSTCGLNQVNLTHSLINGALAVANMFAVLTGSEKVSGGLDLYHKATVEANPLTPNVELGSDGLLEV